MSNYFHAIYGQGGSPTPTPSAPELLWTNSTPSSDFASQTISLDLSDYEGVIVEAYQETTNLDVKSRAYIKKGETHFALGRSNNEASTGGSRNVSVTNSEVVISNCVYNTTTANNACIPYKIYGVKGVLIEPIEGTTLWTNSAPTSEFAAQTVNVTLPLHFKIVWKVSTTDTTEFETEYHNNEGGCGTAYGSSTSQLYLRKYGLSGTGISFDDANLIGSGADNGKIIPYKIIAL